MGFVVLIKSNIKLSWKKRESNDINLTLTYLLTS